MLNKRQCARHQIELPVSFSGDALAAQGVVTDISFGGCKVETPAVALPGDFLEILIDVPGRNEPLEIELAVVRWSIGLAFGVEFIRMKPNQQVLLQGMLRKLEALTGS
jgi:hypothetical protein